MEYKSKERTIIEKRYIISEITVKTTPYQKQQNEHIYYIKEIHSKTNQIKDKNIFGFYIYLTFNGINICKTSCYVN